MNQFSVLAEFGMGSADTRVSGGIVSTQEMTPSYIRCFQWWFLGLLLLLLLLLMVVGGLLVDDGSGTGVLLPGVGAVWLPCE